MIIHYFKVYRNEFSFTRIIDNLIVNNLAFEMGDFSQGVTFSYQNEYLGFPELMANSLMTHCNVKVACVCMK